MGWRGIRARSGRRRKTARTPGCGGTPSIKKVVAIVRSVEKKGEAGSERLGIVAARAPLYPPDPYTALNSSL